jgi:hypothetical protein
MAATTISFRRLAPRAIPASEKVNATKIWTYSNRWQQVREATYGHFSSINDQAASPGWAEPRLLN